MTLLKNFVGNESCDHFIFITVKTSQGTCALHGKSQEIKHIPRAESGITCNRWTPLGFQATVERDISPYNLRYLLNYQINKFLA